MFAIFAAIESLDLPDIGLDARILQGTDGLAHQGRASSPIVGILVHLDLLQLYLRGRHQQLEHEALRGLPAVVGQLSQAGCLPQIERGIAIRVIAHQHFREGRPEGIDVLRKRLAIFELELVRTALLDRDRGDVATAYRIAKNAGAEFFINQNAGARRRHPIVDGFPEAIVDELLAARYRLVLVRNQRRLELEHAGHIGLAMIERQ